MSQGTLYANFRIRTLVPQAIVKYLGLDVKIVAPEDAEKEFSRDFPLKKVPTFAGPHGYKLMEVIAIMWYLVNLSEDEQAKAQLLGANNAETAQILKWISLSNSELCVQLVKLFAPLLGNAPYIKKDVDAASIQVDKLVALYEERLRDYTYLATEEISLADLFSAAIFTRGFNYLFGSEWISKHPVILRWFRTVIASPILKDFYNDFKFIEKPLAPPQPKKKKETQKPQKKKEGPAQVAEAPAETPKKPKHPLELLGKSTFVLDEWKRTYSNEDTRPVALPWFWKHYNPEEYSIWRVDYKYNDELTLTFMSNNLVGGFFNRLSASTKYMFGCLVVYGENNDNGIIGAVMVRGQDYVPAFDVAPDWESYKYTKLDPSNEEDKEFVNNMWAWDKPVIVDGKPREIADGKVLK